MSKSWMNRSWISNSIMKSSIKRRLFISIYGLIVFFVLLSWVLNTQYLSKYYTAQKKHMLMESYKQINTLYENGTQDISLELEKMERTKGIQIVIKNPAGDILFTSVKVFNRLPEPKGPPPQQAAAEPKPEDFQNRKNAFDINKDRRLNTNFIRLTSMLSNGDSLILSTPVTAIQESAEIANRFFLFTGMLTIVLGSIAVFLFSKSFTKPISELSGIAQSMAKLDFSKKYTVETQDEIGELGQSINSLSDQLDKSISELRTANEKLMADVEKERKIDEMRKEFISNISHELKTPIALVQGYAEGLKINVNSDEENKNYYCEVILDEAKKMDKLVRELLDLSQMESGFFKLERSVFDLSELIDWILEKYQPTLAEKNIHLSVEKEPEILVDGDALRIEQVLLNYITNAVNHMNEEMNLDIKVETEGNKVRVSVYNSGEWISEECLDKIWISFYKVDKARTRAYGGAGLGLSIVKNIMECHQNRFGATNVEGGVAFWFEMDKV